MNDVLGTRRGTRKAQVDAPRGPVSAIAPFNPTSLIGTQGAFWTAAAGVTGSPSVTAWADQGPHSNNLTVAAGPLGFAITQSSPAFSTTSFNTSFPGITFTANSTNGLFVGSNAGAGIVNSTTISVMALMMLAGGGSSYAFCAGTATGGSDTSVPSFLLFNPSGSTYGLYAGGFRGNGGAASGTLTTGVPHGIGAIFDSANANMYVDYATLGVATAFSTTLGQAIGYFWSFGLDTGRNSAGFTLAYCLLTNNVLAPTDITNLKIWTNSNWGTAF